jgi:hypothetical protein
VSLVKGLISWGACAFLFTGCLGPLPEGQPQRIRGPLAARVMHPILLTQLGMPPRRAVTQAEGTWAATGQFSYASIYERRKRDGDRVNFDGEQARAGALVRRGLGPKTDIDVDLALTFASSGFLDSTVDAFHEAFLFPEGGRNLAETDQYAMVVRRNGVLVYSMEEDRVSFTDVPVVLTHQLRVEDENGPAVAVRAGLEFPTGSEERGTSNGGLDWGVGVLMERNYRRSSFFAGLNWIVPNNPDSFDVLGIHMRDRLELQLGAEVRWSTRTSVLFQANWLAPMVRDFVLEELNREILDIGIGVARDLGEHGEHGRWVFSFHDDAVAATGADFGVRLAFEYGF